MSDKKYKVWTCKIIIPDVETPSGFDSPPRMAAIEAIEAAGIEVLVCASGWGGTLDDGDRRALAEHTDPRGVYYAGLMDTPEDTAH